LNKVNGDHSENYDLYINVIINAIVVKSQNTTLNATSKNNEMIVKNDLLTLKTFAVIESIQYAKFYEIGFRMKRIPSQKYLFLTEFEDRTVTYRPRFPHFNLWLECFALGPCI